MSWPINVDRPDPPDYMLSNSYQSECWRAAYRWRSAIECTVGALKEARAVATRYEKLAIHYLTLVKLGMVRLLLRRLEHPLLHRA